ncbi:hypothetical protein QBC47DRAFT_441697 [Echria macrotheca]|uniref:Uncharacterized protein n=1 Tax=Echria macrotheca TaxID=438768 RepID=A0AAJ0EZW8_9PEZI|nr:hypothetical protein QBC47DRAFT_441697 [Echria macrotheca]
MSATSLHLFLIGRPLFAGCTYKSRPTHIFTTSLSLPLLLFFLLISNTPHPSIHPHPGHFHHHPSSPTPTPIMHQFSATMSSPPPPPPSSLDMITMPPPQREASSQLHQITTHLTQNRTRLASLCLLKLDTPFYSVLATSGGGRGQIHLLRQVSDLFTSLMQLSYLPGFSKPVDRCINRLLYHAVLGCEHAPTTTSPPREDDDRGSLRWLAPHEYEIRELLETYRGFFNYITFRESGLLLLRDKNLLDAGRKLQSLRPRISTLSPWREPPVVTTPPAKKAAAPQRRPAEPKVPKGGKGKRVNEGGLLTPSPTLKRCTTEKKKGVKRSREEGGMEATPPPSHGMELRRKRARCGSTPPPTPTPTVLIDRCMPDGMVPTMVLSRPPGPLGGAYLRGVVPREEEEEDTSRLLRVVDGVVEEVTQAFEVDGSLSIIPTEPVFTQSAIGGSEQLRRELREWETGRWG